MTESESSSNSLTVDPVSTITSCSLIEPQNKKLKLSTSHSRAQEVYKTLYDDDFGIMMIPELIALIVSYETTRLPLADGREVFMTFLKSTFTCSWPYTRADYEHQTLWEWGNGSTALVLCHSKSVEFPVPVKNVDNSYHMNQEILSYRCHMADGDPLPDYLIPEQPPIQPRFGNDIVCYTTNTGLKLCPIKDQSAQFLDITAPEFFGAIYIDHNREAFTGTMNAWDPTLSWIEGQHDMQTGGDGEFTTQRGTFSEKKLSGHDCIEFKAYTDVVDREAKYGHFADGKLTGDFNTRMRFKESDRPKHPFCITTHGTFTGHADDNGVKMKCTSFADESDMLYDRFQPHLLEIGQLDEKAQLTGDYGLRVKYPPRGRGQTEFGEFVDGYLYSGHELFEGSVFEYKHGCKHFIESPTASAALAHMMDTQVRVLPMGPQPTVPETPEQAELRGKEILDEFKRQAAECAKVIVW
jgi:hypothetical protein